MQRYSCWKMNFRFGQRHSAGYLQSPDLEITLCRTLAQAQIAGAQTCFDLLILDVNLRTAAVWSCCARSGKPVRYRSSLLTVNDMKWNIVTGLESGADDYIQNPLLLRFCAAG